MLLTFCLLLLPLWESVIVLCFVVCYFKSILVLQSSWWGSESWLLCLNCLPGVSWWLSGSSSRCHGVVCSLWLWYFLIILTYYFWSFLEWPFTQILLYIHISNNLACLFDLRITWLEIPNTDKPINGSMCRMNCSNHWNTKLQLKVVTDKA